MATDQGVDGIVDVIVATARTSEIGDNKIFILPVEDVVRDRTGGEGTNAV